MTLRKLDPGPLPYPMPTAIVGAMAGGSPIFTVVSLCGIVNREPPLVSVGIDKDLPAASAIEEALAFSVNLPSSNVMKETGRCARAGRNGEETADLFTPFFGDYQEAPMPGECPLCLECSLLESLDYGGTEMIFIGQVLNAYADESVCIKGAPAIEKIDPVLFSQDTNCCFRIGKNLGQTDGFGPDPAENDG